MVPSEADLIDRIVDQMHLGVQNQIDMFSTEDIALAERRSFIVMIGIDRRRQGLEMFGSLGGVDLRGSHDVGDGYPSGGVKSAGNTVLTVIVDEKPRYREILMKTENCG